MYRNIIIGLIICVLGSYQQRERCAKSRKLYVVKSQPILHFKQLDTSGTGLFNMFYICYLQQPQIYVIMCLILRGKGLSLKDAADIGMVLFRFGCSIYKNLSSDENLATTQDKYKDKI